MILKQHFIKFKLYGDLQTHATKKNLDFKIRKIHVLNFVSNFPQFERWKTIENTKEKHDFSIHITNNESSIHVR